MIIELDTEKMTAMDIAILEVLVPRNEPKRVESAPIYPVRVSTREIVIESLKKAPKAIYQLAIDTGKTEAAIRALLYKLEDEKLVVKSSTRPTVYYYEENTDLKDALKDSKVAVFK